MIFALETLWNERNRPVRCQKKKLFNGSMT